MKRIVYSLLALSLLFLTTCREGFKNDLANKPINAGEADFTTYVALGNSLTAGYQDGALFKSGQLNSYPAILAKQMEKAGRKGEFKQPLRQSGGACNLLMVSFQVLFLGFWLVMH